MFPDQKSGHQSSNYPISFENHHRRLQEGTWKIAQQQMFWGRGAFAGRASSQSLDPEVAFALGSSATYSQPVPFAPGPHFHSLPALQPAFSSPLSIPQGLPSSRAEQGSGKPVPGQLYPALSSFASLGWGHPGTPAGDKYDSARPRARTDIRMAVQEQNPLQYDRTQIPF